MTKKRLALVAAMLVLMATGFESRAQQQIDQDELKEKLRVKIRSVLHLAHNPVLVRAVREQNNQGLTLEDIRARDAEWTATEELTPFKLSLQLSDAGEFLRKKVDDIAAFTEAFATDNQGANVAAYPATSDYWQGDEEKWTASWNGGNGTVFVGGIEVDESTNQLSVQVSAPIMDQGVTIGVLVVGITSEYVEQR